jgi:flavin-dependent dehydrogenase
MNKRNIVIVGGGTAGWLTALYIKKIYDKDANVSLIESEELGILGAGEGSTPNFPGILNYLGIPFRDFIVKTNATHKLGISFENWNGDGKNYYHPFGTYNLEYDWMSNKNIDDMSKYFGYAFKENIDYQKFILSNRLADENYSPLLKELVDGTETSVNYGFHFDAQLVAKYLRSVAEKRKINRIEGIVKNVRFDDNGFVKKIVLKDNTQIKCDFVFDCTGFRRLLIGKEFRSEWKSYSNSLKVNSAITFQLPQSSDVIEPYTKAIAMKYGWMWMIPLQNRIGCGYIFDKFYIGADSAIKEVEEFFGKKINFGREIQFDAGRFEKIWIKNCIAVGLSAGFTEPIEATSIFTSVNQLFSLNTEVIERCLSGDEEPANVYNKLGQKFNDLTKDFLQFHYFTKREDTEFWKTYFDTSFKSEELVNKINNWKNNTPTKSNFIDEPFTIYNWLMVALGLDFLNKDNFVNELSNEDSIRIKKWFESQQKYNDTLFNLAIDESEAIELIKMFYYG